MSFKTRLMGFTQNALMKFANTIVDRAALIGQRPEAYSIATGSMNGRLQRNQGGERIILSPTTLWKMAHMDPITWAIINKFKSRITKMRWEVGPDIQDQMTELGNWEKIAAAALSPYAPKGYKPDYEAVAIPEEIAKPLSQELNKLTAKTPQARMRARWLFDEAESALHCQKSQEAVKVVDFFKNCNQDSPDPFKDLLETVIDNLLTYDAGAIVKRRTKGGSPYEMYAIDGSQIVRYRNPDLSTPQPPDRAYAWEVGGRNVADFTTQDILYMMANPQTSGYGFSPLEATVHTIMASLYADSYNLDTFRSQIPPAIMNLGPITDAQRLRFRTEWQNEVMGRGGVHRIMFVNAQTEQGKESKLQLIPMDPLKQKEMQFMEYLKWTLVVKCMAYQISPQDVGFTADLHRTTAEVQEHISAEGVLDMANLLENYFNAGIIKDFFGYDKLAFRFVRDEAAPDAERAKMDDLYVRMGALSLNEVRERLGKRPIPNGGDEPFIMTRTEIIPVSEIFGRDSSRSLDVDPADEKDQVTDATPPADNPGAVDLKPEQTQKTVEDALLKLRGTHEHQRQERKKKMQAAKNKRKGLFDNFELSLKTQGIEAKKKALEAVKEILGEK